MKTKYEKYINYNREYQRTYSSNTTKGRYYRLKSKAKTAGRSFNIHLEEFISWYEGQNLVCHYCGKTLTYGKWKIHNLTDLTIDRKDSNLGYALDNIVLSCRRCNLMKGDWLTHRQTLEIAQRYFRG